MDASKKVILVTGGIKSGKSRFALDLANKFNEGRLMIATATAFDEHMRIKIRKHQEERGQDFKTVEESVHLAQAIKNVQTDTEVILVDCATMWINNLFHQFSDDESAIESQIEAFIKILSQPRANIIIVTNEVGLGIMPDNTLARRYADRLGRVNQRMAVVSDEVVMLISGIPQWVKGVSDK